MTLGAADKLAAACRVTAIKPMHMHVRCQWIFWQCNVAGVMVECGAACRLQVLECTQHSCRQTEIVLLPPWMRPRKLQQLHNRMRQGTHQSVHCQQQHCLSTRAVEVDEIARG